MPHESVADHAGKMAGPSRTRARIARVIADSDTVRAALPLANGDRPAPKRPVSQSESADGTCTSHRTDSQPQGHASKWHSQQRHGTQHLCNTLVRALNQALWVASVFPALDFFSFFAFFSFFSCRSVSGTVSRAGMAVESRAM